MSVPVPVPVPVDNPSASSKLSASASYAKTCVISRQSTNVLYQSSADHTAALARRLSARNSAMGTPAPASSTAWRSTSGSPASHSHSSRTSGSPLGPSYRSRSSATVSRVNACQADNTKSVWSSLSAASEESVSACGPPVPLLVPSPTWPVRDRCADSKGSIRRQSSSERGCMDQQHTFIVAAGGISSRESS